MVDILVEFIFSFWILFPAYAANVFPPLAKGKHPIDFGKKLNKHRILGNGKTFEGFALGLFSGFLVGALESYLYPSFNIYSMQFGFELPFMSLSVGFMIALGALVGDLIGSFIKRRLGMKRGENAFLLDQLDFVIFAILFAYMFTQISIWMILIMLIITPIIHRLSCMIGYKLRIKREPW
ncbi:MAG: CDP-2,3-bis-(O-geranylgeranyl)-sn-glycerol synthase [Candidatus Aenigmatarchaeota archaeon]